MKLHHAVVATTVLAAAAATSTDARAATCNVEACTAEIQAAAGLVVNEVFTDSNGHTATQLPVYGKLVNNWPGCPERVDYAGAGHSIPPYDCPGQYVGDATTATVASANVFLSSVDRQWWQPCRLGNGALTDIGGAMCVSDWTCIADGLGGNYNPWQGLVFDLGGPSNKVAIFAENDHGPQPCESLEYTVFLSDNPNAHADTDIILDPSKDGVDPMKWNRAVLSKVYTKGFVEVRPPDPAGHAACGDVAEFSVEEDSFVQVFSLPCGITFRYAAIVAGNDGRDFPSCAYDSNEGEIDAVAGLTESGSAVCPDADNDHYVDCNCPGAPPICDCNDGDPTIHPGAPEACDATVDYNCDNTIGTPCAAGLVCNEGSCLTPCGTGENPYCPPGSVCKTVPDKGNLCLAVNCNCSPGQVCIDDKCVDACDKVVCPGAQVCLDGQCFDPCSNIECPQGQLCQSGQCVFPCGCFAGDIGCNGGLVCDVGNSNTCVPPVCKGISCPVGQTCDGTTGQCISFCNGNVHCPAGQKCDDTAGGCIPFCQGVTCPQDFACDPESGQCVDVSCEDVTCFPPQVCEKGKCVTPDGGTAGGAGGGGTGGAGGEATGGAPSSSSSSGDPGDQGSCGCRVPGEPDEAPLGSAGALALLGLAAAAMRRRK
ncbi:internalin, putative [Minicystis rosea]|nr:internalin, putative [Minicystis rosea]